MPLADLLQRELGVRTYVRENPLTTAIGTAIVEIVSNNPRRLQLTICNRGANSLYLAPDRVVSATKGIYLAPSGSLTLYWDRDMEAVSWSWYALSTGAGTTIYVIEVLETSPHEGE